MIQLSSFAYIMFASVLLTRFLILVASRHLENRTYRFFFALLFAMLFWEIGYLIELLYISDDTVLFVARLQYIGISLVPVLWFLFVRNFLGHKIGFPLLIIFFVIPIITLHLALIPKFDYLMWTQRTIEEFHGLKFLQSEYGPWFWIQVSYAYFLLLWATLDLIKTLLITAGSERTRIAFLLAGALVPWIANILTIFGKGIFEYLDLTPFAFMLTIIISGIDIYAFFLFKLRTLAQRLVYQNIKDIVIIVDAKDVVVEMNPFALQFFEQKGIHNLRGQKMEILFTTFNFNVQVNKEDEVVFMLNTENTKNYFELSVTRLSQNGGKNIGTLIILHNISERIETENRLSDQISKNKEQRDLLIRQARLASMGEMLGAIAHQWRQPLNALGLMIQDLKDAYEYGELDQNYINDNVSRSMEQISFLSGTIDDFRNFFKRDKEREVFSLPEVIRTVLKILSIQLEKHRIIVSTEYHKTENGKLHAIENTFGIIEKYDCTQCTFEIKSIPNEVKQVLLNLINNAKDAILEHRKKTKTDFEGKICIRVFRKQDFYKIEVQDNGGGISPEIFDRIFEPYFSTKGEGEGTGIGLYMSRMIVENSLGGNLTVTTQNKGATFYLFLPFKK